jgi:hypothetical protein
MNEIQFITLIIGASFIGISAFIQGFLFKKIDVRLTIAELETDRNLARTLSDLIWSVGKTGADKATINLETKGDGDWVLTINKLNK